MDTLCCAIVEMRRTTGENIGIHGRQFLGQQRTGLNTALYCTVLYCTKLGWTRI
jgi:hypothetical protein